MRRQLTLLSVFLIGVAASRGAWADAPTVVITSPPANAIISEALTPKVLLQASVMDADEAIGGVTFFLCWVSGTSCLTAGQAFVSSPPYQVQWTTSASTPGGGTLSFMVYAVAYNALGQWQQSPTISFTYIQIPSLSVTLVAPTDGSVFVSPTAPVLYATASPGDTSPPSTIARVDFLDGDSIIGTVTTPNAVPSGYALVWQGASPGMHLIAARATDTLGNARTSRPITVSIIGLDPPPLVALSTPTTGQIFAPPSAVPLAATASSALGTIQRVEFATDGMVIATALSQPYAMSWVNPPPGNFAIVATAYDVNGVATTSPAAYVQVLSTPRPPAVVLTAPAPGATVPSGTPLLFAASALAPDGGIGRVDFYSGATLLGSAATAPYQFSWANPTVGALSLLAKAYDLQGRVGVSSPVSLTVTSGPVPVVTLTAPAAGATFTAPATIGLSATASEAGGSIARVDFFANGSLIGTAINSPYNFTWGGVAAGNYTLTAKATDARSVTATSAAVAITVLPAPSATLTAPAAGTKFAPRQSVSMTAQVSTPGRTIARVEFLADGSVVSTVTPPGSPSSATVTGTWTAGSPGTHTLSARVVATDAATAVSPGVVVTVVDLVVNLAEPFPGEIYLSSADVRIIAGPTETGDTIAQVDFYGDGASLGTRTTAPFTLLWTGVSLGGHTVTATARDSSGRVTNASAAISVIAAPTIQIDSGIDGSTVADDVVLVSGSVQAPPNSSVIVNGNQAALDPGGRFLVDVPLRPGANVLTVVLSSEGIDPVTRSITVTQAAVPPFAISLAPNQGLAPFTTTATLMNRSMIAFGRVEIDTNGDGTPEFIVTALPNGTATRGITFSIPGAYRVAFKVYDAGNVLVLRTTRTVRAIGRDELGAKVVRLYTTLVDRLTVNDPTGAVRLFVGDSQQRYADILAELAGNLPVVASQLGTVVSGAIAEDFAELVIARGSGPNRKLFMVHLILGSDGIWRMEDM